MSRFNLTRPFGAALQSVEAVDPWQGVVTFSVRPSLYGPFQRALEEHRSQRDAQGNFLRKAIARAGKTMARAQWAQIATAPAADGDGTTAPEPPDHTKLLAEAIEQVIEETPEEAFERSTDDTLPAALVAHLVEGWTGLLGEGNEPVPFSEAALLELLEDDTWIPAEPGNRYTGMIFGAALRAWLVTKASEATLALRAAEETARKNSERSSGGASRSSRSSRRPSAKKSTAS